MYMGINRKNCHLVRQGCSYCCSRWGFVTLSSFENYKNFLPMNNPLCYLCFQTTVFPKKIVSTELGMRFPPVYTIEICATCLEAGRPDDATIIF